MRELLNEKLHTLAKNSPQPLYVVGGAVRDFLSGVGSKSSDFDLCSPMRAEEFIPIASSCGFQITAVYKTTGTIKIKDEENREYEYASFRSDKYVRGKHVPSEIFFTDDILLDAKRRDFTANAVYYDILKDEFIDPLNDGISAIKERRLTTVDDANKVFGEDGLRLMRLARQTGQLGFTADTATLLGAKNNATLIQDVSPERIFSELNLILLADLKQGVPFGHYLALKTLDEIGVLEIILPELTLGRKMLQRADFHKYDVLEHSLRATMYADKDVRLAVLLHDVGKPYCFIRDGNSYDHPTQGAKIAQEILTRFKAPKKRIEEITKLVAFHMYDFDLKTKESKLRRFIVENYPLIDKLLAVKQADYSGCMDDTSLCPTAKKWQEILTKMQEENAPFSLKNLKVKGSDLIKAGYPAPTISKLLNKLLLHVAVFPKENKKERLLSLSKGFYLDLVKNSTL
ncbi:MAG: CCA tRNA nucleotidyltransferase [Clostridiales bacterium]|nr:CCA tRNA nucleotidyltransferase [Clostridiales bacterium]